MVLRAIGRIEEPARAALEAVVAGHRTLELVVRWAIDAGLDVVEVVGMDEYTFDVVVAVGEGLHLVFDST